MSSRHDNAPKVKQIRLYRRMSKFAYYRGFPKYSRRLLLWAANLQAGDLVSGCTTWPFNTIVDHIETVTRKWRRGHGSFVDEIGIYTTDGRYHSCPGGGCVERPLSPERIREILSGSLNEEELSAYFDKQITLGWCTEEGKQRELDLYRRARSGQPICDERGMRLPQDMPPPV